MKKIDLLIVGAGPAGMAAALAAYECGVRDILLVERDNDLGGILQQCIHNGFGLHKFKEELTGPEYAARYATRVRELEIPYVTNTMVMNISPEKVVTVMNAENGIEQYQAKAVVLAMGCRERPRGALNIPGSRPAGIYTAGTAQRYVNIKGEMPGREVVILGSGDIGLIMARRMTFEGAKVRAVCELMPYSGGLQRNIVQCLEDFDIPLKLSHTVSKIHGNDRICGVTVSKVDENLRPIEGESEYIPCDTLLLSCGLIPENELTSGMGIGLDRVTGGAKVNQNRETEIEGVFACGNVLHVHDLVDFVSEEAELAGTAAADYIQSGSHDKSVNIALETGSGVRYTVPQVIDSADASVKVYFRVGAVYKNVSVKITTNGEELAVLRKRKLAPGEMESVTFTPAMLTKAGSSIKIEVAEVSK